METLALPVLVLVAPGHDVAWRGSYLVALLAFSCLWASMQRVQVGGGDFMALIGSLPFSARQLRHVDIVVLLLADSPLLLPIGCALASIFARHGPPAQMLLVCDVVLLALVTQVAVLEQRFTSLPIVVLVCFILVSCFDQHFGLCIQLMLGVATGGALWIGPRRRVVLPSSQLAVRVPGWLKRQLPSKAGPPYCAGFRVSLLIVYLERRNELIGKAVIASSIVAVASSMVKVFDADARSFPTILIAQGVVALTVSGMFRYLHMAHRASELFTGALPLSRHWSRVFDLAAVATISLPFLAALAVAAWLVGAATIWHGAAGVMSYLTLLCVLALPHRCSERHAVAISSIVAGCWIAATIACLT